MKNNKVSAIIKLLHRGFLLIWAAAIFWFYLGNLINFHQNRIWGKVLIPACFTHSSINNKDSGTLQYEDDSSVFNLTYLNPQVIDDIESNLADPKSIVLTRFAILSKDEIILNSVLSVNLLRGPPIS